MSESQRIQLECVGCNEPIQVGQRRRPTADGVVHEECEGYVHHPQENRPIHKWAFVFSPTDIRVFEHSASPFEPPRTSAESDWTRVDKVLNYDGHPVDIRAGTFTRERNVTVLYAEEIHS